MVGALTELLESRFDGSASEAPADDLTTAAWVLFSEERELWIKVRLEAVPRDAAGLEGWFKTVRALGVSVRGVPVLKYRGLVPSAHYDAAALAKWTRRLIDIEDVLRHDGPVPAARVESARAFAEESKVHAERFLNDVRTYPDLYRRVLCGQAARHGFLHALAFGAHWGFELTTKKATTWAAEFGHPTTLRFCLASGARPTNSEVCTRAARGGRLACLKVLRGASPPAPWDEMTCAEAARGGHIDLLKWLRANGCPWNERTTGLAEANGHVDTLRWACERGCEYKPRTRSGLAPEIRRELSEFKRKRMNR